MNLLVLSFYVVVLRVYFAKVSVINRSGSLHSTGGRKIETAVLVCVAQSLLAVISLLGKLIVNDRRTVCLSIMVLIYSISSTLTLNQLVALINDGILKLDLLDNLVNRRGVFQYLSL